MLKRLWAQIRNTQAKNLIERAVIRSNNGVLPNPLPITDRELVTATMTSAPGTLADSTRAVILQALQAAHWVIGGPGGAAARLGLARTTLIAKMNKLGISRPVPEVITNEFAGKELEQAVVATID